MTIDFITLLSSQDIFQWVLDNANYWLVFILMVVESSFIPFPSEVVVPPAAYLACSGGSDMNVVMVVVVATLGAIAGALINYFISLWIGRPVVYAFADSRIGHVCLINREKVEKAEAYFDKHGNISTLIGRLIPVVRQLISIPAGLAKMNIAMFVLYTAIGAGIWNAILGTLGYWLSRHVSLDLLYATVEQYNDYLTYAGVALGVVCLAFILWNLFKKSDKKS